MPFLSRLPMPCARSLSFLLVWLTREGETADAGRARGDLTGEFIKVSASLPRQPVGPLAFHLPDQDADDDDLRVTWARALARSCPLFRSKSVHSQ